MLHSFWIQVKSKEIGQSQSGTVLLGVLLLYVCDLSFNVPLKKGFLIASAFYLESCTGVLSQDVSHTWKFLE